MNDGYDHSPLDNIITQSFERLVRKLLSTYPGPPALMMVHFLDTRLWGPKYRELPFVPSNEHFWATAESHYDVIANVGGPGAAAAIGCGRNTVTGRCGWS